ncbi:right-handed parallel beta-helix repeat-containing protein [Brevibacillus sp. AY1]|uniref:right-handed parallel beta-helix repeat-containing protein n=1 Tax=Brevibacillus sp. AY1 TaxID=2807621 RepID=UPI002456D8CC|nr:right-handed parallel beta-helix repeat-containing protein [Brevibacillus sp. AY1]MDH4619712.1 right-handed parallel beta-helix repeat-containing protein [Brevibacillus sp. AY1]
MMLVSVNERGSVAKAYKEDRQKDFYVNITDFGAIPNDAKNDAEAIQKAIDFLAKRGLSEGGGVVFIPRGEYLLNKTIEVKDNITLMGEGSSNRWANRMGSNLVQNNNSLSTLLRITGRDTRISQLGIRGDESAFTDGITLDGAEYVTIDHSLISHMGRRGIYDKGGVVRRIQSNSIYHTKDNAIEGKLWDSYLAGNDIGYGKIGLYITGGPSRITGNKFWLQGEHAVWLGGNKSILSENDIQYPGGMGVYINSINNIVNANIIQVAGRTIHAEHFKTGIFVNGSQNSIVGNLLVQSNREEPAYGSNVTNYGIYIAKGGHSDILITQNQIERARILDLYISDDAENVIVEQNIVH